jgi:hypothetical protein
MGQPIKGNVPAEIRYAYFGNTQKNPTNIIRDFISSKIQLILPSEGDQSPTPGTNSFSLVLFFAGLLIHSEGRSPQPFPKRFSLNLFILFKIIPVTIGAVCGKKPIWEKVTDLP